MSLNKVLPLVSALVLLAVVPSVVRAECRVETETYSSNDGLIVSRVAQIVTFTAECTDRKTGETTTDRAITLSDLSLQA